MHTISPLSNPSLPWHAQAVTHSYVSTYMPQLSLSVYHVQRASSQFASYDERNKYSNKKLYLWDFVSPLSSQASAILLYNNVSNKVERAQLKFLMQGDKWIHVQGALLTYKHGYFSILDQLDWTLPGVNYNDGTQWCHSLPLKPRYLHKQANYTKQL